MTLASQTRRQLPDAPRLHLAAFGLALIIADLTSKTLAHRAIDEELFWIRPGMNDELALGVASSSSSPWILGALVLGVGIVLADLSQLTRPIYKRRRSAAFALTLVVSGGLANGVDRIAFGAVRDWLYWGGGVANLADLYLIGGLGLYLAISWNRHRVDRGDVTTTPA